LTVTLAPERRKSIYQRITNDPVWFVEHVLGGETWSKQQEILEAVRDHPRVAVRSCHGVGKTWTAARVVLWWLACHKTSCAVVTTAPTWQQVNEVLWREIHSAYHTSRTPVTGAKLLDTQLEIANDRFAIGLSPDPHKATNFQGFHAKHLLFVVDEASGVDERIFEAAEGFQTARGAKMLMIGNPTSLAGTFFNAFGRRQQDWKTIHVSAYDSPNFTGEQVSPELADKLPSPEWVDAKKREWGADSPVYQVRVLGDFPETTDDTVIPLKMLDAAIQRRDGARHPDGGVAYPRVLAVDVARFGSDETVIGLRDAERWQTLEVYQGQDLMATTGKIIGYAKRYGRAAPLRIVVDDAGLGGGVTDRLREYIWEMEQVGKPVAWDVDAFNGGSKPISSDDFLNRRAEAWYVFGDALRPDQDGEESRVELPDDELLRADLLAPKYKLDSQGRIVLEPKEKTKERLGRSPDRGDAVVMAWAPDQSTAQVGESPW
jgi:phage terminase large subunit